MADSMPAATNHLSADRETNVLTAPELIERCHQFAQTNIQQRDPDSLIGFFQVFRPDGKQP